MLIESWKWANEVDVVWVKLSRDGVQSSVAIQTVGRLASLGLYVTDSLVSEDTKGPPSPHLIALFWTFDPLSCHLEHQESHHNCLISLPISSSQ